MQIPVLIDSLPGGHGFRATTSAPFSVSAEATDRTVAIDEVRKKFDELIVAGRVVSVDVGTANPLEKLIGTLDMNDPRIQKWWDYVEEFRSQCDSLLFPGEESGNSE